MTLGKKIKNAVNIAALVGFIGGTGTALIIECKSGDYLTADAKETIALERRIENLANVKYELSELEEHKAIAEQYSQMQEELKIRLANPTITASITEYNDFRGNIRVPVCIAGISMLYGLICVFGAGRKKSG